MPKVLYGLASLGVGTCLAILRHPAIAHLDENDGWADRLEVQRSTAKRSVARPGARWGYCSVTVALDLRQEEPGR